MDDGRLPRWVVFDLGETLVDETRNWGRWADHLDVPRLTFFAVMGVAIAERRPHTDAFDHFRPGSAWRTSWSQRPPLGTGGSWRPPTSTRMRCRSSRTCAVAGTDWPSWRTSRCRRRRSWPPCRWTRSPPPPSGVWPSPTRASSSGSATRSAAHQPTSRTSATASTTTCCPRRQQAWSPSTCGAGRGGVLHAEWPEAVDADARIDQLAELPAVLQRLGFLPRAGQPGRQ